MKKSSFSPLLFVLMIIACSKLNPFAGNDCPDIYIDMTVTNQSTLDIIILYDVIGDICIEDTSLGASGGRLYIEPGQTIEEKVGENDAKSLRISLVDDNNVQIIHNTAYIASEGLEITVTITHDGNSYNIEFS